MSWFLSKLPRRFTRWRLSPRPWRSTGSEPEVCAGVDPFHHTFLVESRAGAERSLRSRRLSGPGAQGADRAARAVRAAGIARGPAVSLEEMTAPGPLGLREHFSKLDLHFVGAHRFGKPEALGDPEDVGVDGDGLLPVGVAQHDVGGLPSHPRELDQFFEGLRNGAAHLDEPPGRADDAPGLRPVEARRANLFLQGCRVRFGVVLGGSVLLEEAPGGPVSPLVPALGRAGRLA